MKKSEAVQLYVQLDTVDAQSAAAVPFLFSNFLGILPGR